MQTKVKHFKFTGRRDSKVVPGNSYACLKCSQQNKKKLGNLSLPAGVMLCLPTILVHQDHELWGDNASEFRPERFSVGISKATEGRVSFFPFGWAPWICIGQNFEMMEAKMALTTILQRF